MSLFARLRDIVLEHTTRLAERVDGEAMSFRSSHTVGEVNRRIAFVLLGAAACLLTIRFLGNEDDVSRLVWILDSLGFDRAAGALKRALTASPDRKINMRIFWCISRLTCYGIIPALIVRFALRERISDYGLSPKGALSHARTYLLLFAIVMPFVVAASYGDGFQAKYPYYKFSKGEPLMPNLLYWELLYGSQFIALEVFFRGFLIHGLRPVFGYGAIFVPIVPYVMIHFAKPLPEAIGSAITGFVLGTLSLRTRSIWGGAGIHIGVACSMDLLSLWQRGFL